MKKIIISVILISATTFVPAQIAVKSIQNNQTELLVNDSLQISRGDNLQIYLPSGKDFYFIKQKKSVFNSKLIGKVADIAGTGASAVGLGSGNVKVLTEASKVINTARTVQYGTDAIDKISELPITDKAKKLAGKKITVIDWTFTDDGWIIIGELDKKKYEIFLQEALMAGEIKL